VPSQIHAYLSSNHKDQRKLDKSDPASDRQGQRPLVRTRPKQSTGFGKEARESVCSKEFDHLPKPSTGRKLKEFALRCCVLASVLRGPAKDYQTIINIANKLPDETLQEDEKLLTLYDMALTRTEDGL
jgi:hypothetical protein